MELKIDALTKSYGAKVALEGFTASLTPGIYGLLGPNGAGKSTLMNIIAGNVPLSGGAVYFDGESIERMGARFRKVLGFMPQQQNLYPHFTARRFMFYMAALKGMDKSQAKEEVEYLLGTVNLEREAGRKLGAFSGGMKQRILLAQALLGSPDVLVLDEPTAGLDPKERIRVRNLISEIAINKIVIFATHVVSDIEYIAKEILLLKEGHLIAHSPLPELLKTIDGKVFRLSIRESELKALSEKYLIGDILNRNGLLTARVVADAVPEGFASEAVEPALEDVYLYNFGDI